MATVAPSWASRMATARPMPCEAPVTSGYWPTRREEKVVERSVCGIVLLRGHINMEGTGVLFHPSAHRWDSLLAASQSRSQDLVQDDGAKGCGADPADREGAEFEREVAGACGERDRHGDQVCRT